MKMMTRVLLPGLLICCVACASGQGARPEPPSMGPFDGASTVSDSLKSKKPRLIAVMPFVDQSRSRRGEEVVRRGFYNHFSSLGYQDMELHVIDRRLLNAGYIDAEEIHGADRGEIARIVGADALIFGRVSNFDKLFAVVYSQVSVGAEVTMYDAKTGELLWSGEHTVRYHQGGVPTSLLGVASTLFKNALNMRDIQLLRACDDLFRGMVQSIPSPGEGEALRPPRIQALAQDSGGRPLKSGDRLTIVMQGEPDMAAWVEMPGFSERMPMEEVEPGGYRLEHMVIPGDNVDEALVIGHLMDKAGNTARWVDPLGTVTFDTTPPATPTGLRALGRAGEVSLSWEGGADADLAGYRVTVSATPLSGYTAVGTTEFTRYAVTGLSGFKPHFFRVAALDRAGNASPPAGPVKGVPVAAGPTPVSGSVARDATWYAGAGPYIIEREVVVADEATLTIEPGTRILSTGPALVVRGVLSARGDEGRIIEFAGKDGGKWDGIVFENTTRPENTMSRCRVKNADTGVTCRSSSPAVRDCELVSGQAGLRVVGKYSEPEIIRTTIADNTGPGVVVAGGTPLASGCTIRANGGAGVLVENGEPRLFSNVITKNLGSGIRASAGQASVIGNDLYDNEPYDAVGPVSGMPLVTEKNYWGGDDPEGIMGRIAGKVVIASVRDAPAPNGAVVPFPMLDSDLSGFHVDSGFLLAARSPFIIRGEAVLDAGAVWYIQPGVRVLYDSGASLVVRNGGIVARGAPDAPIMFDSAGASPAPGDYRAALRFTAQAEAGSFLEYCSVRHAVVGIDAEFGQPEISRCQVSDNSQAGIRCRNDAGPKVLYSTIAGNRGAGGIECVGLSRPRLHHNNIVDNAVGVQAFSSIQTDARDNWWGRVPPDESVIWGANIVYEPYLSAPEPEAFRLK